MRLALILIAVAAICAADDVAGLDAVARVASLMVDGDVCRRIQTDRSLEYMTRKDPRDPWIAGDNYDVNQSAFTETKKTLMRLAKLCKETCDVNLWMPLPSDSKRVQIVIRNVNEISQFWTWGALTQDMPAEMKQVLNSGERVAVRRKSGMTSILAPVYDSLGDIVGLVEVVSQDRRDPRENVK